MFLLAAKFLAATIYLRLCVKRNRARAVYAIPFNPRELTTRAFNRDGIRCDKLHINFLFTYVWVCRLVTELVRPPHSVDDLTSKLNCNIALKYAVNCSSNCIFFFFSLPAAVVGFCFRLTNWSLVFRLFGKTNFVLLKFFFLFLSHPLKQVQLHRYDYFFVCFFADFFFLAVKEVSWN